MPMDNAELQNPYWLCCGSLDPRHTTQDAGRCIEAESGHSERCRFGTREEHSNFCNQENNNDR